MADKPYPAEDRLGKDLALSAKSQPPTYSGPKTGRGRWVTLWTNQGRDQLGYLWVSETGGGLGFVPSSDKGIQRVPEFYQAFSGAKAAGTPAMDVFLDWAGRHGQGLSAGEVETGDLDTLPE